MQRVRTRKDMLLMWLLGALLLCPSVALAEDLRIPSLVDRGRDEGIVGYSGSPCHAAPTPAKRTGAPQYSTSFLSAPVRPARLPSNSAGGTEALEIAVALAHRL